MHTSNLEGDTSIDEFAVAADGTVDSTSRRHVLGQGQPYANHNGGTIVFGPDRQLYIALGDGGSSRDPERRAGKLDTLLGKFLRITPTRSGDAPYAVPSDNPFVDRSGARPEIWAYGLRNPWKIAFDAGSGPLGDLWIADVGQNEIEEINRVDATESGIDFGWSAFEGTKRFNDDVDSAEHRPPIYEYRHGSEPLEGCSITGGFVYRGTRIAGLNGAYLFGDYCVAGVRALSADAVTQAVVISPNGERISAFGEGPDREAYVTSIDGALLRLDPAA